MQKIVAFIPNLFTLGNLFCGCLAIIFAFDWRLDWAAYMVFLAAFLDFFDGFLARMLKVSGELGKQLDSLADMVSFGVVPGIVVYQLLVANLQSGGMQYSNPVVPGWHVTVYSGEYYLKYLALLIPVFSCYRLAKFNIDTRQSHGFIGLPTPANAIFFCSISLIITFNSLGYQWGIMEHTSKAGVVGDYLFGFTHSNPPLPQSYADVIVDDTYAFQGWFGDLLFNRYLLIFLSVFFSLLLVSPLPLFALKFKNFGWKDNKIRYIFLVMALALLIVFQLTAIPFIVILYILISIVNNIFKLTV